MCRNESSPYLTRKTELVNKKPASRQLLMFPLTGLEAGQCLATLLTQTCTDDTHQRDYDHLTDRTWKNTSRSSPEMLPRTARCCTVARARKYTLTLYTWQSETLPLSRFKPGKSQRNLARGCVGFVFACFCRLSDALAAPQIIWMDPNPYLCSAQTSWVLDQTFW